MDTIKDELLDYRGTDPKLHEHIRYMSDLTRMGVRPIFICVHYLKIILR